MRKVVLTGPWHTGKESLALSFGVIFLLKISLLQIVIWGKEQRLFAPDYNLQQAIFRAIFSGGKGMKGK